MEFRSWKCAETRSFKGESILLVDMLQILPSCPSLRLSMLPDAQAALCVSAACLSKKPHVFNTDRDSSKPQNLKSVLGNST